MSLGLPEILIILVIVLIIFGAGKLPRVMGDMAKGVKTFRAGLKEDDDATAAESDTSAAGKGETQTATGPEPRKDASGG